MQEPTTTQPTHEAANSMAVHHLLSLARAASALYAATGSLQQDMLRRSAALQREAAGELARAVHPGKVLNVQAAFAVAGVQQMVDFSREWGDRMRAVARLG